VLRRGAEGRRDVFLFGKRKGKNCQTMIIEIPTNYTI
jgi:hypothetical protein